VLIPGAIKTKNSQCAESQRNKTALSSRLSSVRQMSCCRSSADRLFHSSDVIRHRYSMLVSPLSITTPRSRAVSTIVTDVIRTGTSKWRNVHKSKCRL